MHESKLQSTYAYSNDAKLPSPRKEDVCLKQFAGDQLFRSQMAPSQKLRKTLVYTI